MNQKILNLHLLVLDPRVQSRVAISEDTVTEYAHDVAAGDQFPPITVHFDGVNYYLSEGFHRYHAHRRAEKTSIVANVIPGTLRDAILFSLAANAKHGLRRTPADKRKSVQTMLDDPEWSQWNNSEIAKHCGVSAPFVKSMRDAQANPEKVKYTTKTGKVAERNTETKRTKKQKTEEPEETEESEEKKIDDERQKELITSLSEENTKLKDRVALAAFDATEEERNMAERTIAELREQVRILEIELEAVKKSRDTFQNENAQMRKQIAMMRKQQK